MKSALILTSTFLAGALAATAIFATTVKTNDQFAAYISREIYDCGIRVSNGEGEIMPMISDGTFINHKHGVCIDGNTSDFKIANNTFKD